MLSNGEIPAWRTANSNTYLSKNGHYKSVFSMAPMNYQTSYGAWVPIDDTLARQGDGTYRPAADSVGLSVPSTADQPVIIGQGTSTISTRLLGAAASPAHVSGSDATYESVVPNVDQIYTARPGAVQDTLRLTSPTAPTQFTYAVTVAAGLSLRANADGSISVLRGASSLGALPAPTLHDSSSDPDRNTSTAVAYSLTGAAPNYTLTVTADASWVRDPSRVYPVLIDPYSNFGFSLDLGCYIASPGAPDQAACSQNSGTDNSLMYGSTAYKRRMLVKFGDLTATGSPVPPDAVVDEAYIDLKINAASNSAEPEASIYNVTAPWTSSVTWANQPPVSTTRYDAVDVFPFVGNDTTFWLTQLAAGWVSGDTPNNGFEMKLTDETPSNTVSFNGFASSGNKPELAVEWEPAIGQQPSVQSYEHRLSDRLDLRVGYADRNLQLTAADEQLTAPGLPLTVRRSYNSLDDRMPFGIAGGFGGNWILDGGTDVRLHVDGNARSGVSIDEPGGAHLVFARNFAESDLTKDDAFTSAPGSNATLTSPDTSHWKLSFHQSKLVYTFTQAQNFAWLSSITDRNGNKTIYAAAGSPSPQTTSVTDSTGQRSVSFSYTNGTITTASEHLASGTPRSWTYGYDSSGRLTSSTDADGKTTRYCYQGTTQLITKVITPRGAASGASCTTVTNIGTTDIAYDSAGAVTSITYEDSAASPPITITFASLQPLTRGNNGIARVTDPYGKNTDYTYDTRDRVTKTVDPLGDTRTSTYNTNNSVTAAVDPNNAGSGTQTSFTFDPNKPDNLTKIQIPTGASVSATYTGAQTYQPNLITDDQGHSSTPNYNSAGQLTDLTKGSAKVVTRHQGDTGVANCGPSGAAAYKGAVCETRDADYSTTTTAEHRSLHSYNSLGELVSLTPPQPDHARATEPAQTFTYDGQSRVATSTDSRGKTLHYSYDPLDRLTQITYPDGHTTTYTYDEDGDRRSTSDKTGSETLITGDTWAYDPLDRMVTETASGQPSVILSWDSNSRLISFDNGGDGPTFYGYDSAGGLTSVAQPGGSCAGYAIPYPLPTTASKCILFAVDKNGNRLRTVLPGDVGEQNTTYDASGRPVDISGTGHNSSGATTLYDYAYSYTGTNDTGHVTKRTNTLDGSTLTYSYTTEGRLTSAVHKNSAGTTLDSQTWCYDANGNRTNYSIATGATCPGTASYSYDGANAQLTGPDGASFSFDPSGDETATATGIPTTATARTSNWSDSQQNTSTTLNAGTALANTYLGPSNDQLLTTATSATDQDQLRNTPLGISQVARTHSGSETSRLYTTLDPHGGLLGLRTGTGTNYYTLTDNMGSVLDVLSSNGFAADTYTYDPYGKTTSATTGLAQPFGYTSAYTQPTTDLLHLGARYYDPHLGRFTQPDPRTHPGDPNQASPYPYTGDDPITHTDPTGHDALTGCVAGGSTGALIGSSSILGAVVGAVAGCATGAGIAIATEDNGSETGGSILDTVGDFFGEVLF